jgi:DNA-3-methyladenine glycosylase
VPAVPGPSAPPPALPEAFFARPAEAVAPDLIGCLLLRRGEGGELRWGVIVETEAYSQSEPACHGHRRRSRSNETLFGPPGRFYVYVSYGIHHCVNVVTDRQEWADGVLLRAAFLPRLPERTAAGPALLARRFDLDRRHDALPVDPGSGVWLAARPAEVRELLQAQRRRGEDPVMRTQRIGIREGRELPWRWYLRPSRSVSRRAAGDRPPRIDALAPLFGGADRSGGRGAGPAPTVDLQCDARGQ